MTQSEFSIRNRILAAMPAVSFNEPASLRLIEEAEHSLAVTFPDWLKDLYLTCDGFAGPTEIPYMYPLLGYDGVVEFTLFMRNELKLSWLNQCALFGENGGSGSTTVHWGIYDGKLIQWRYGDGDTFTEMDGDFFMILKREQAIWDELESDLS